MCVCVQYCQYMSGHIWDVVSGPMFCKISLWAVVKARWPRPPDPPPPPSPFPPFRKKGKKYLFSKHSSETNVFLIFLETESWLLWDCPACQRPIPSISSDGPVQNAWFLLQVGADGIVRHARGLFLVSAVMGLSRTPGSCSSWSWWDCPACQRPIPSISSDGPVQNVRFLFKLKLMRLSGMPEAYS